MKRGSLPISIVMPVFNGSFFLKDSISSILGQTFTDFEFIIIDDGSYDNSIEVINSFSDPRIVLLKNYLNTGLINSLNKGFEASRGRYIVRMDADDISLPERLEKQYNFMENNHEVVVCGTWFETFGSFCKIIHYPISHEEIYLNFLLSCPIGHPTSIIRSRILKENKLNYDSEFEHSEDTNLWIRIADYGQFANIPEVLLKYRIHINQITSVYPSNVNLSFNKSRNLHFINICKKLNEETDLKPFPDEGKLTFDRIKELERKLMSLIKANRHLNIFNDDKLSTILSRFWILIINSQDKYSLRELKFIFESPLLEFGGFRAKYKAMLIRKSLISKFKYFAHSLS